MFHLVIFICLLFVGFSALLHLLLRSQSARLPLRGLRKAGGTLAEVQFRILDSHLLAGHV